MENENENKQPLEDAAAEDAAGGNFITDIANQVNDAFTLQTYTCEKCQNTYRRTPVLNVTYSKIFDCNICDSCIKKKL